MATHRLLREYTHIQKTEVPNILARPLENDILEWRFAIFDLPDPYSGGIYHGKIVFPTEYPLRPPSIQMMTPSGRFQTNTRICMSMTDFHPESWNPAWRAETVLLGLVSFMLDAADPATAGGLNETRAARRAHALRSFTFNKEDRIFRKLFPELCDESRLLPACGFFFRIDPPTPTSDVNEHEQIKISALGNIWRSVSIFIAVFVIIVASASTIAKTFLSSSSQ
jgi:ubiquitin-conjugating enzyme E2 J2